MPLIAVALLTFGLTKLVPETAEELVKENTVCVRALPAKGKNKAAVSEVLWSSLLRKGDVFETIVGEPDRPGVPAGPGFAVAQDSILFMKRVQEGGVWKWKPALHRVNLKDGKVAFTSTYAFRGYRTTDGELVFQVDDAVQLPGTMKHKSQGVLTFAEIKAALLGLHANQMKVVNK